MNKIILKLNDLALAEIVEGKGGRLDLKENKQAINLAKEKYPLQMRYYKTGLSGLVYPVELFLSSIEREDIIMAAGITKSDTLFTKLYKVAGLKINPLNGFYLVQG